MKKLPYKKRKKQKCSVIDCYGIEPKGKGKVTFATSFNYHPEPEFRDLGDTGHPE